MALPEANVDEMHLFGEIAIARKLVTVEQVREALAIQRDLHQRGEGHKLVGVLLVDLGYITPAQVVEILETSDAERPAAPALRLAEPPAEADPLLRAG